ncbi:Bug family tripartite tricarboxylate transporter substrate binding protein [Terripilifer ovatus]|uniref:Bug family tripartite tricarboxylate transporter substrate binding protein n=1 Tax=Terripilifer ovatus TaxID=3032367 RepID=UPI003AB99B75
MPVQNGSVSARSCLAACLAAFLLVAATLWIAVSPSAAQTFPNRPIRIVVPAAAGGALDVISRLMAIKASEVLKQQVYIENKPGANWIIGMDAVAKAAPDGYTLLFIASSGITVNPFVFPNMPLDPLHDLTPVTTATTTDFVLLVNPSLPVKTIGDFIRYLKANPGKLNHASNSATTMLVSELFKAQAGVEYVDVNYRGASQAIQDAAAGVVQFCFVDLGTGTSPIEGKLLVPLAITGPVRSKLNPSIPTLAESGLPGYSVSSSTLLLAPANVPAEIMAQLNAAFRHSLETPEVNSKLVAMGQVVVGNSAQEAEALLKPEADQFRKLIADRNIQFAK